MRYVHTITLLLLSAAMFAEEVEKTVPDEGGTWVLLLVTAIAGLITWIGNILRKKVNVEAASAELDANKTLWEQKNLLIDQRVIPFAISTGEHWLTTNVAPILIDATDGNGFKWGEHFDNLKAYVKDRVLKKFASENVDLLEHLADKELDDLLNRLLLKLITKLPDSIAAFLPAKVTDMLAGYATDFIREKGLELIAAE